MNNEIINPITEKQPRRGKIQKLWIEIGKRDGKELIELAESMEIEVVVFQKISFTVHYGFGLRGKPEAIAEFKRTIKADKQKVFIKMPDYAHDFALPDETNTINKGQDNE